MIYLIVMEVSIPEHGGSWNVKALIGELAFESMEDAQKWMKEKGSLAYKIIAVPIVKQF